MKALLSILALSPPFIAFPVVRRSRQGRERARAAHV
jgi:hypothetical protein